MTNPPRYYPPDPLGLRPPTKVGPWPRRPEPGINCFPIPTDPPPTKWSKRATFVNRQKAGKAVLENFQNWIRPNTDMQKQVNLHFGAFCGIFDDITIEMAPLRAHLSW